MTFGQGGFIIDTHTMWVDMQPWERIEIKLKEIEEKIESIRQDVNAWKPHEWESYYENDPFDINGDVDLDWYRT